MDPRYPQKVRRAPTWCTVTAISTVTKPLRAIRRDRGRDPLAPVRGRRAAHDSSSSSATPTPSSMGETRTSFTNLSLCCPGSVVCAPVVLWAFTDICRLKALAQEGSGTSLAVRGATCVAPRTARCGRALFVRRVRPPPPLPFG